VNAYIFVGRTAIATGYREDERSVGLNLHSFCPQTFLGFPKHSSAPCWFTLSPRDSEKTPLLAVLKGTGQGDT